MIPDNQPISLTINVDLRYAVIALHTRCYQRVASVPVNTPCLELDSPLTAPATTFSTPTFCQQAAECRHGFALLCTSVCEVPPMNDSIVDRQLMVLCPRFFRARRSSPLHFPSDNRLPRQSDGDIRR